MSAFTGYLGSLENLLLRQPVSSTGRTSIAVLVLFPCRFFQKQPIPAH